MYRPSAVRSPSVVEDASIEADAEDDGSEVLYHVTHEDDEADAEGDEARTGSSQEEHGSFVEVLDDGSDMYISGQPFTDVPVVSYPSDEDDGECPVKASKRETAVEVTDVSSDMEVSDEQFMKNLLLSAPSDEECDDCLEKASDNTHEGSEGTEEYYADVEGDN
ncbi:uncharacterized protein LOC144158251 isoform X2 [Haemaphysalis longicornis]